MPKSLQKRSELRYAATGASLRSARSRPVVPPLLARFDLSPSRPRAHPRSAPRGSADGSRRRPGVRYAPRQRSGDGNRSAPPRPALQQPPALTSPRVLTLRVGTDGVSPGRRGSAPPPPGRPRRSPGSGGAWGCVPPRPAARAWLLRSAIFGARAPCPSLSVTSRRPRCAPR